MRVRGLCRVGRVDARAEAVSMHRERCAASGYTDGVAQRLVRTRKDVGDGDVQRALVSVASRFERSHTVEGMIENDMRTVCSTVKW